MHSLTGIEKKISCEIAHMRRCEMYFEYFSLLILYASESLMCQRLCWKCMTNVYIHCKKEVCCQENATILSMKVEIPICSDEDILSSFEITFQQCFDHKL